MRALRRKRDEGRADVALVLQHPALTPVLPLSRDAGLLTGRGRLLRSLARTRPGVGDLLETACRSMLDLLEFARLRTRWRRLLDDLLSYWYWRGVGESIGSNRTGSTCRNGPSGATMGGWLKRHRWVIPYALLAPGMLWLLVFYVYPAFQMFIASLWSGTLESGFTFSLSNYTNYTEAIDKYSQFFVRSIVYAAGATILTFLISYPLAYTIAFKGGRYKNVLLFLVVAPFFTSFLLRTISWKIILGDGGPFLGPLKQLGVLPEEFRLLATPIAVISGITYSFLPFMTLPVYVALEKVDTRFVEAAKDLYAGPWRPGGGIAGGILGGVIGAILAFVLGAEPVVLTVVSAGLGAVIGLLFISESFVRVTFPLSLPGVFAGSLLVFIPAIGDYINAEFLGNPQTNMLGNVIQNLFLTQNDYPTASALSFTLMAGILVVVAIYARALGTEELATTGGRV
jgi:spermidine/putrescine transport system permease protein